MQKVENDEVSEGKIKIRDKYVDYFYIDSGLICEIDYSFGSTDFNNKYYPRIMWREYNSTHYFLNLSIDCERTPSGYVLVGEENEYEGQLYNLEDDPKEQNNLYGEHPDKVMELTGLLEKIKGL